MDDFSQLLYNQPFVASLLAIAGFVVCLTGYKLFRLYSASIGLIIGVIIGYYFSVLFWNSIFVYIVSGIALAVVFWLESRLGLFLTGAVVGYMFLSYLLPERSIYAYVFAVLCGILVLFVERFLFILITAFLGATAVAVAVYILVTGTTIEEFLFDPRAIISVAFSTPLMFLLWFTLGILGIISQLVLTKEEAE